MIPVPPLDKAPKRSGLVAFGWRWAKDGSFDGYLYRVPERRQPRAEPVQPTSRRGLAAEGPLL